MAIEMATLVDTDSPAGARPSNMAGGVNLPYVVTMELDFADAVTEKGTALAANDIIEIINVPAGTLVYAVSGVVTEAHAGTSTDLTLDVGVTGGDIDAWVDGFDFDGASVGDRTAVAAGSTLPTLYSAAGTIDVELQTMTGTTTGGKMKFFAFMVNVADHESEGAIAAPGS